MVRPTFGSVSLLVYRECPCGQWLATGEGAEAPLCAKCGGHFVPGGGPKEGQPMFGSRYDEARRERGLGFVAFLTREIVAASLLNRVKKALGLLGGYMDDFSVPASVEANGMHFATDRPHYHAEERQQASDEIEPVKAET